MDIKMFLVGLVVGSCLASVISLISFIRFNRPGAQSNPKVVLLPNCDYDRERGCTYAFSGSCNTKTCKILEGYYVLTRTPADVDWERSDD